MSTNHEYDNGPITLCELRPHFSSEMARLVHFFQTAVTSSLLGSERADDCQFLEIEQRFYYIFFRVTHSATTRSKVQCSHVKCEKCRINSSHQKVGVRHSEATTDTPVTHKHAWLHPLHQTAFASRLGTFWLGWNRLEQGEATLMKSSFPTFVKTFCLSIRQERITVTGPVIQPSKSESSN